jgi:hypothetical protein
VSPSKFIKGWETFLAVGLMKKYIFHYFVIKLTHIHLITIMKIYIFYYEVLLGQSRTINGQSDFHQKEKTKKPLKILNPFPLIHLEVVNIDFSLKGQAPL